MDKKTEALKLALEALEDYVEEYGPHEQDSGVAYAITAIREALAEQPRGEATLAQRCKYGNEPASCTSSPMDCQCAIDATFEQQEPVAYAVYHRMGGGKSLHWPEQHSDEGDHNEYQLVPLYASPQPSPSQSDIKPWVGLTEEERGQVYANWRFNGSGSSNLELCRAIEAKLREKNA